MSRSAAMAGVCILIVMTITALVFVFVVFATKRLLGDQVIVFAPGQDRARFVVDIVEDNIYENEEEFYLDLVPVRPGSPESIAAANLASDLATESKDSCLLYTSPSPRDRG